MGKAILSTIFLSTILLTSMIATSSIGNANAATEIISIKSGNAPTIFLPDSLITFLPGPTLGAGFPAALTPTQFDDARNGPNAIVIPKHPAWISSLSVDPSAKWIGTAPVNPNGFLGFLLTTALYAVDFEITSATISSASLDIYYASDNTLGDDFNQGVFINGISVAGTQDLAGDSLFVERSFKGLDISSMVNPGTNTLYVLGGDLGPPAGLLFHVDITVEEGQPPVAVVTDVTVLAGSDCTATASIDDGSFDPDEDPITITQDPPGPYPLGDTLVTLTVSDGTDSDSDTATVTVVDDTPPNLTVPDDITEDATGLLTEVDIGEATASDNCSVEITNDSPGSFPVGTTIVTWTATDGSGNPVEKTQSITVEDNTPPIITLLGDNPATAECSVSYTDAGATALDVIVDGDITSSIVTGGLPIDTSILGSNIVTYDVSDLAGNAADQESRTVNVVDETAPSVSAALVPVNGEDDDDEGLFRVEISASDSCDANPSVTADINGISVTNGQIVELEIDDDSETEFEDGILEIEAPSITLTATATDASGNSSTATANPTFVDDDEDDEDEEDDEDDEDEDDDD